MIRNNPAHFAFENIRNDIRVLQNSLENLRLKVEKLDSATETAKNLFENSNNNNNELVDKVRAIDNTMVKLQKTFENTKNSHSSIISSLKDEIKVVKNDIKTVTNFKPNELYNSYETEQINVRQTIQELKQTNTLLQKKTEDLEFDLAQRTQSLSNTVKQIENSIINLKKIVAHILSSTEDGKLLN